MKLLILGGVRVQTCITSPPYFGLRDFGVDGQFGLEPTPAEYVARMVEVFQLVRELLADDGTLWLNLGDSYANDGKWGGQTGGKHAAELHGSPIGSGKRQTGLKPKDLIGIPWRVAFALQEDGWYLRSDIIWHKPSPMPESVKDRPTKSHEYIFLLSKSEDYFYDADAIKERSDPDAGRDTTCARRGVPPGGVPDSGFIKGRRFEFRNKRSVWKVSTVPYHGSHFATFPPKLITPCVLAGSRPGDVVFDPFIGSGTTALVAKKNGRRWLGCELNREYKKLQDERLAQDVLFGAEAPA
jgi:DNA modification methylase